MNTRQTELYTSLSNLVITPPGIDLSFEARLARENRWDLAKSIAVVNEYRKFLFLMLEAGHPVTPSDEVDQAWHLHLLYTDSYWNDLCGRIAGRPLHHGPTAGGTQENDKYHDWYARTKKSYQQFFGATAPETIWPDAEKRFGKDLHFQRVNTGQNWIFPKPDYLIRNVWSNIQQACSHVKTGRAQIQQPVPAQSVQTSEPRTLNNFSGLLTLGLTNPLDFSGLEFLKFYLIVMVIGLMVAVIARWLLRDRELLEPHELTKTANKLDAYQVAYMSHGPKGPVDVVVVELSRSGRLTGDSKSSRLFSSQPTSPKQSLLEQTVLSATGSATGKSLLEIRKECGFVVKQISETLQDRGLVESASSFLLPRAAVVMSMTLVMLLGFAKIFVGLERGKPVGFLIILCVLVGFMIALLWHKPRLTRKGKQLLKFLRKTMVVSPGDKKLSPAFAASDSSESSLVDDAGSGLLSGLPMSIALFGLAAAGMEMLDPEIKNLLKSDKSFPLGDSGWTAGGCGSDSGGGCGGGGCGGCGGCGG